MDTVGFFKAVDGRDAGMVHRREGLGFARESRKPIGIVRERIREDFEGDLAIQLRVVRPLHFAHPASAEQSNDAIGAQTRTGVE
jgi:hypothetical protein